MQDSVWVTGMVLKAIPVLETDKRITLLTKERGKITVFARGAKKMGSRFMAATEPFVYGTFQLYEGKKAYNLMDVHIDEYFDKLRTDFEAAYLCMYFCEVADYYTRENNDDVQMLRLLYVSVKAVLKDLIPKRLIQYLFEMKALVVNGEFPGILPDQSPSQTCSYIINYVQTVEFEKLYSFKVSDEVIDELQIQCKIYTDRYIGKKFNSLEIVENCRLKN